MTMRNLKWMLPATGMLLASAFLFPGCKKDRLSDNPGPDAYAADRQIIYDHAVAESSFDDAGSVADEGVTGTLESYRLTGSERILTSCATITVDTTSVPRTADIDFGPTDCLCKDGNYRRGVIHVEWTGRYRDSASTHTITFIDYYLNFNKIDGTKTVTNIGRNASGHLEFSIDVNGMVTIDPQYSQTGNGGTITHVSARTRTWTAGEGTFTWLDDIYLISGTASGTTTAGGSYTMQTQAPLRKEIGFLHFTSGVLDITPTGKAVRSIDYGYVNGNRDNLARVTVNGVTFTIVLGGKI